MSTKEQKKKEPNDPKNPIREPFGAIKVRATQAGHYGDILRKPGDEFEISDEKYTEKDPSVKDGTHTAGDVKAFSTRWMEYVDSEKHPDVERSGHEAAREAADNREEKIHKTDAHKK